MRSRLKPFRLGPNYGGVNKQISEYIVPNETATLTDNWVLRNKGITTVGGWAKFTDQVLTDGEASPTNLTSYLIEEFILTDGTVNLVHITNKRAYYFDEVTDLWIPFTEGTTSVNTDITVAVTAGDTVITVTDTTGFSVGEEIIVGYGTNLQEYMIIDSLTATTLTLSRPSWAPAGTGTQNNHAVSDLVYRVASMEFETDITEVDSTQDNDVYYWTDGVNAVQKWTGTGFHVNLPGLETGDSVEGLGTLTADLRAKQIEVFIDFLVIGNLVEEGSSLPTKIRWCQIGEFETWENNLDGSGQAGAFRFDGPGEIKKIKQLKQDLILYREQTIEAMSYIGLPEIFFFRRLDTDTGLVSTEGFVDRGDVHSFVGQRNIYDFAGIAPVPIGDPIKDDFFNTATPTQLEKCMLVERKETNDLMLFYSTTDQRVYDSVYIYHTRFRGWAGPRDIDATSYGKYKNAADETWDDFPESWPDLPDRTWDSSSLLSNAPLPLLGNNDGLVFVLDTTSDGDGVTLSKRYETKRTDLGAANLLKTVQSIRIGADTTNNATIQVYLGVAFSEIDPIEWKGPYPIALEDNYHPYVYFDEYGRYFKVRIDTDEITTLKDIEMHFYPRSEI